MNRPEQGIKPTELHDHCTQAREIFKWMEALAGATADASKNETWGRYRAQHLAELMHYLAVDWANYFDGIAESTAEKYGFDHDR